VPTITLTDRGGVFGASVCHPGRVTVAPAPARRRLVIQAAVGLACVAIVVVALWMVAGLAGSHRSSTSGDRPVQATVTASASCQGADSEDSISFTMDGGIHQAKLNGCGHRRGEAVEVLVPAAYDVNTAFVQSNAVPGDSAGLSHRIAFLLLIVATVVGGACGYRFFRTRGEGPGSPPPAKATRFGKGPLGKGPLGRSPFGKSPFGRSPSGGSGLGRKPKFRSRSDDDSDDPTEIPDYHTGYTRPVRNQDPEATGVDWFEDSSAHMYPVPPPADLGQRTDRS
jgi:hypothetical protein